jgi:hypothetical protein
MDWLRLILNWYGHKNGYSHFSRFWIPSTRQIEMRAIFRVLLERSPEKAGVGGSIRGFHILKDLVITKDLVFLVAETIREHHSGDVFFVLLLLLKQLPDLLCRAAGLGNVAAPSLA